MKAAQTENEHAFVLHPSASAHLPQQFALSLLQGLFVSEDESLHFGLHHLGFDLHLLGHGLDLLHAQLQERRREKVILIQHFKKNPMLMRRKGI